MITTHKIRTHLVLNVPKFGSRTENVRLDPQVIEAKWTRNNHLIADELTVTVGWKEGGVDPRAIKNARCAFYMWDESQLGAKSTWGTANDTSFELARFLRFTGIGKKIQRRLSDQGWVVDLTFHDYTTLFIHNKPLKTSGLPEYSMTLRQIWERICDNTGWQSPDNGKILSSVEALRDALVFTNPEFESRALGELVNKRFLAAAKPTPKQGASSWDVWQWCVCALGLISYIDCDRVIVTDSTEHYKSTEAAFAVYGQNIHSLEESVDTDITSKGILLKSFDPVNGRVLEAFYPQPGDERLKTRRSAVGPKSEGGATVTANEVSADYEEFERFDIIEQAALDRAAMQAYEERSRQELEGSFKTAEVALETYDGKQIDIFDLRAGDAVMIETQEGVREHLLSVARSATWGDGSDEQVRYLVQTLGYDEDVAELIVANLKVEELGSPVFHISTIEVDYGPEKFEVDIKFHNLILIDT